MLTALEEAEIPLHEGAPTSCINAWIPEGLWMRAALCIYKHDGQGIEQYLTPDEEMQEYPSYAP